MTRGQKFAAAVRAEYDLNLTDDMILDELAATLDTIDSLPANAVVELRQQRSLASRLAYQLALPDPDAGSSERRELTSRKASRAARVRWNREAG